MTTPVVINKPTKAWVGLLGSVLSFAIPLLLSVTEYLPDPWPAIIGAVLAVLTALGIYKVPNRPTGEVVVKSEPHPDHVTINPETGAIGEIPRPEYRSPWPRP